jgi:hypothetical protein
MVTTSNPIGPQVAEPAGWWHLPGGFHLEPIEVTG